MQSINRSVCYEEREGGRDQGREVVGAQCKRRARKVASHSPVLPGSRQTGSHAPPFHFSSSPPSSMSRSR